MSHCCRVSEAEREQRRRADRERVKEAASELLSSQGWQRWVRARQAFHAYSWLICGPSVIDGV
jgi:hypothetical protein